MEIRHLRYFLAVAEVGHITRAAEQLGMQQPPLSQQIRALEADLGFPLFVRHPKGVRLTDAGHRLQDEARRLLADFEAMRARMRTLADGKHGPLAVGFTSSAAAHAFTPETLRACRSRYPGITLTVREHNAAELTEAVAAGTLHCGFLRVPVSQPAGVVQHTLLHEPAVLALPRGHALAGLGDGIGLAALQDQPLVLVRRPGAPGLYANLLALCAQAGVQVRVVAEVERMMSNLNLVAAGAGISVVPASMRGLHPQAVVYRALDPAVKLDAPLTLVWRDNECSGPTATFVALVRKLAAAHLRKAGAGARDTTTVRSSADTPPRRPRRVAGRDA